MEGQSSTSITLSVDEMTSSIRSQLDYYRSLCKSHTKGYKLPLIYRVQKQIREGDPIAYEPIYVSIGPYHHYSPSVLSMEREKWMCLKYILSINNRRELKDYISAILNVEEQVRLCYQDDINIESNNLIQILLVDGCFLLHSLYATNEVVELSSDLSERRDMDNSGSLHETVSMLEIQGESSKGISSDYRHSDTRVDPAHWEPNVDSLPTYNMVAYESNCITRDILLIENQVPFFVIKLIYDVLAYEKTINVPLTETLAKYMEDVLQYYPTGIKESNRPTEFYHLLHLCHIYFKPTRRIVQHGEYHVQDSRLHSLVRKCAKYFKLSNQHENVNLLANHQPNDLKDAKHMSRWRRAVQYYEAGVQFVSKEISNHDPHSLLDIAFDRGVLEIPSLPIDDKTCTIFRNCVAFEQACPEAGNYLTAYIVFMSQLMSTAEDVTLLCRKGIVMHHMRCDADVSKFFGKLGKNVDFDMSGNYYLKPLCHFLEAHYQNRIKRWMAWLWKNHFSNPWLTLAVVAAAIVLICTILQTWFSLLSYMYPTT